MANPTKFLLPSPNFGTTKDVVKARPHYLTPSGMTLLPRHKQPPPMYGARGSTVPAKFLQQQQVVAVVENPAPPRRYHCESCRMEFQSHSDYRLHQKQHESCPAEGCKYSAIPLVLDKHVSALHLTGLYNEVKKMSTPEEINAWRAERRKKYPTVATVEMHKRALEQRQRRGERLEASRSRFGKLEDRRRVQKHQQQQQQRIKHPTAFNNEQHPKSQSNGKRVRKRKKIKDRTEQKRPLEQLDAMTAENEAGIPMFKGTSCMEDYKHFKAKRSESANALTALLGMYGSDDEDTEDTDNQELESDAGDNKSFYEDGKDCQEDKVQQIDMVETDIANVSVTEIFNCEIPNSARCDISVDKTTHLNENAANTSSDDGPEEAPIVRVVTPPPTTNEEMCSTTKQTGKVSTSLNKHQKLPNAIAYLPVKRISGLDYRKMKLRKQNTLLEKLLETDIRHERNVLLQCVRFVCENEYFGIGK